MRRLPHLNGVKAFEATARHGSFAAAGAELNVTAAAVSRMVRLLEARLGIDLFQRGANNLRLTPAGRMYQQGLAPILNGLALLTEQVRQRAAPKILTIGVGPTFAIRWLIPRLSDFQSVAPDIEVRVTTGGAAAPFADDWTCGIKLGDGHWPGLEAEELFAANLIPVCAPRFARKLTHPRQLRDQVLLRVAHAADDWALWGRAASLPGIKASGPVFEYYGQAIQAAADGLGIALGIRPYIDDDLAAGRLATPFDLAVPKGSRWYLIFRPAQRDSPTFQTFARWIKAVAGPGTQATRATA